MVTGGCGFIGLNLIEFLLEKTDWKINVFDNLSDSKLDDLTNVTGYSENRINFFKGDIRNKEDIEKAIENCDYVVNLAAQVGVMSSIKNPVNDAELNIIGLINMLDVSVKNKIKKFIQASSAAPLGDQEMPLDEKKLPKPLSPYGASKLASEAYCSAFSASHALNTVVLRFSNVYGPKSYLKGSVIPLFIRTLMNNEQITIYGDGNQTRDFIYVKDICNAIYLALINELKNNFELFQIATGTETSVNNLFKTLKNEFISKGFEVKAPKYEPERPGEILRNYSDISKAGDFITYKPQIELKDGIKATVAWFFDNFKK